MSALRHHYPRCTESKIRLSGEEVSFECELLAFEDAYCVVRYFIESRRSVDVIELPAGTVTLGLYYAERPYNLYYWLTPRSEDAESHEDPWERDIAYYFNIVEPVVLSRERIAYRDLVVDVLVLPDGEVRVLDESELPSALDDDLRSRIDAVRRELFSRHSEIIGEARELLLPFAGEI